MSRKGNNIYKRKDGRWEARYIKGYVGDKIKYGYIYGKTYTEAKDKVSKCANSNDRLEYANNKSDLCIKTASQMWIEGLKPNLKESTIVKYNYIITKYLYPKFGNISVSNITNGDIIDFRTELLNYGGKNRQGLSQKTVSCVMSIFKNILTYASKYGNINVPDFGHINVKYTSKPMRILSVSEQSTLNAYLNNNKSLSNIGILVCMYTGMRIGEICALKWENISLSEQYIKVDKTMQRLQAGAGATAKTKVIVTEPKSSCSIRKIPIPNGLHEILKTVIAPKDAYLLTGCSNQYVEPRTMQNHFKAVIKNCNIEKVNFHALRHTFATRCVEIGFDIKSLSEILGHATVNITLNRYVHPSMEVKQKNMNMISDLFAVE